MDKKQALAELIKGLKRVKTELEETLAKTEVVPEETFSQKLRKSKKEKVQENTEEDDHFTTKRRMTESHYASPTKTESLADKEADPKNWPAHNVRSKMNKTDGLTKPAPGTGPKTDAERVGKAPGFVNKLKSAGKQLAGALVGSTPKPMGVKKDEVAEESSEKSKEATSEGSAEKTEGSEKSKADSKSRFKDMLAKMKEKK